MKRLLLFVVLIAIAYSSFAQKIRFTDTSNVWTVAYTYWGGLYVQSTPKFFGDTVVNGLNYLKLSSAPMISHTFLVREDTISSKVYFRHYMENGHYSPDTSEYLGYDFNLKVGDSIAKHGPMGPIILVVDRIDSGLIQGTYHKVWHYYSFNTGTGPSYNVSYTTIEGVGDRYGPGYGFYLSSHIGGLFLRCFTNSGGIPAFDPLIFGIDNSTSCILDVETTKPSASKLLVFPNPVTSSSTLKVDGISSGSLVIWNVLGQEVYRQQLTSDSQLPIGQALQTPGIYYYRVVDRSQAIYNVNSGSFVRE